MSFGGRKHKINTNPRKRSNRQILELEKIYSQCQQTNKRLRQLLHKKGAKNKDVQSYRSQLSKSYLALMFRDSSFASKKDLSNEYWKNLFYNFIQNFRRKLKQKKISNTVNSKVINEERLKVVKEYENFLRKSYEEYQVLEKRVKQTLGENFSSGNSRFSSFNINQNGSNENGVNHDRSMKIKIKRLHRIYIALGDLCRYIEKDCSEGLQNNNNNRSRQTGITSPLSLSHRSSYDFKLAKRYYFQALKTLPNNGYSHNQLGVISLLEGDDLEALYRYNRATYLQKPFDNSKNNLDHLFDRNFRRLQKMKKGNALQKEKSIDLFKLYYIRLIGILNAKTNLEKFLNFQENCVSYLHDVLNDDPFTIPEHEMVKLVFNLICMIENSKKSIDTTPIILKYAVSLTFEFLNCLVKIALGKSLTHSSSIVIFIRYLSLADFYIKYENIVGEFCKKLFFSVSNLLNKTKDVFLEENYRNFILPEDTELLGFRLFPKNKNINILKNATQIENAIRMLRLREYCSVFVSQNTYLFYDKVKNEWSNKISKEEQKFLFVEDVNHHNEVKNVDNDVVMTNKDDDNEDRLMFDDENEPEVTEEEFKEMFGVKGTMEVEKSDKENVDDTDVKIVEKEEEDKMDIFNPHNTTSRDIHNEGNFAVPNPKREENKFNNPFLGTAFGNTPISEKENMNDDDEVLFFKENMQQKQKQSQQQQQQQEFVGNPILFNDDKWKFDQDNRTQPQRSKFFNGGYDTKNSGYDTNNNNSGSSRFFQNENNDFKNPWSNDFNNGGTDPFSSFQGQRNSYQNPFIHFGDKNLFSTENEDDDQNSVFSPTIQKLMKIEKK